MYPALLGQNHFLHVPQTCPDLPNMIVRPATFFGVDFLLGTCVFGFKSEYAAGLTSIQECAQRLIINPP